MSSRGAIRSSSIPWWTLSAVALGAVTALGCGSSDSSNGDVLPEPSAQGAPLAPPPAGLGQQLRLSHSVGPGEERSVCQYFVLPEKAVDIERIEHSLSVGSHHILLMETVLTPEDVATRLGQTLDNCETRPERVQGISSIIYGGQPGEASVQYPEGSALRMPAGTVMLLEHHVVNTTSRVIDAEARVNLWQASTPVTRFGGVLHYYDWAIHVPPRSTGMTQLRCRIPEALTIAFGHSHMHDRGVEYRAYRLSGTNRELLFEARGSESVTRQFVPYFEVEAGDNIELECRYDNSTDQAFFQGLSASDNEMCSFIAGYVARSGSRMPLIDEWCLGEGSGVVGHGDLDCAGIDACMLAKADTLGAVDLEARGPQECFLRGCPDATIPFTELVQCRAQRCAAVCAVEGPENIVARGYRNPACQACVSAQCSEPAQQCAASRCVR